MKSAIIFSLLFPALLCAQEFVFQPEYDTIPVQMNGWNLFCPWVGGFTETAPAFADIDEDGDQDLFLGEYFGRVAYAQNTGTAQSADFTWMGCPYDSLRSINAAYGRSNPDFADLDGDGDLDAVIGSGYVTYVQNLGTPTVPAFVAAPETLKAYNGSPVIGPHIALADIDADGDVDLLSGYTGYLIFYQNTGGPGNYEFTQQPYPWLGINVGSNADPTFCDIDADGDLDLFIGNGYDGSVAGGRVYFYRNDGDSANYDFTFVTNYYCNDVGDCASPEFADMDGDGDFDFFVGKEYTGDMHFYENIGTPEVPTFILRTQSYLTLDLEHSNAVNAQFIDIDADGIKELLLPSYDSIYLFENMGTGAEPSFRLQDDHFQNITVPVNLTTTFGDLDADGDYDLIISCGAIPYTPTIRLFLNRGTPSEPNFVLYSAVYITNPNFFAWLYPILADIDADGDLDLFIQDMDNSFYFYQNNGGPSWPDFDLVTSQWQGIHQFAYPNDSGYPFTFGDLDGDLDLDLLMAGPVSFPLYFAPLTIYFYRNQGTPQVPVMVLETQNFLNEPPQPYYTPSLADVDEDGDLDLFIGNEGTGLYFYRNVTGQASAPPVIKHPYAGLHLSMGPNPANPSTTLSFTLPFTQALDLSIYNLLGEKIATLLSGTIPAGAHSVGWEGGQNASGVYLVRLKTEQDALTQKITIIK